MTLGVFEFASFLFSFPVVHCSCSKYVNSHKDLRYKSFSAKNWVMCKFALCICWRASSSNLWITSWRHDDCEIRPPNLIPFFGLNSPRRVGFWLDRLLKLRNALRWLSCKPNVSKECSTGWYTTDIKDVVAKMAPGARMAVLPKLFWLSPVVASGDPPQIWGEQLPGQQESVATDWPNKIQEDVEEHFARVSEMYLFVFFHCFFVHIVVHKFLPSLVACTSPRFTG